MVGGGGVWVFFMIKNNYLLKKLVFGTWCHLVHSWCILGVAHQVAFLILFRLMCKTCQSDEVKWSNQAFKVFNQNADRGPKRGRSDLLFFEALIFFAEIQEYAKIF